MTDNPVVIDQSVKPLGGLVLPPMAISAVVAPQRERETRQERQRIDRRPPRALPLAMPGMANKAWSRCAELTAAGGCVRNRERTQRQLRHTHILVGLEGENGFSLLYSPVEILTTLSKFQKKCPQQAAMGFMQTERKNWRRMQMAPRV